MEQIITAWEQKVVAEISATVFIGVMSGSQTFWKCRKGDIFKSSSSEMSGAHMFTVICTLRSRMNCVLKLSKFFQLFHSNKQK